MSLHHCSTFFASPFFCSPSPLAILSVDMPPVLSPSLALTGLSVLARLSSPLFVPRVCGSNCPASIPLSLSLFPLLLATPLPLARRFHSGSVTWPWTPSLCARQLVSAPCTVGFFQCPDRTLPLRSTGSECPSRGRILSAS